MNVRNLSIFEQRLRPVQGHIHDIQYKKRVKTHKSLEMPRKHPERITHFYFFILDHFQGIYEIELNSHTKSYKSHPKLGQPVVCVTLKNCESETELHLYNLERKG